MRGWILALSFVAGVFCTDRCFMTNDATLSVVPQEGLLVTDNQVAEKFVLKIHQSPPLTYKPNKAVNVTLIAQDPSLAIQEFVVVARVPCDTCETLPPLGEWNLKVFSSSDFSVVEDCDGNSAAFKASGQAGLANIDWTPPASTDTVEFVASVIASNGHVYQQIRSPFLTPYALTPEGQEEAGNYEGDVHEDPREFEEPERPLGDEEEGTRGRDWEEEVEKEEEGPSEDPNEEERYEEEAREESLRRDREGAEEEEETDDHGAKTEEEMKLREEEKRREEMRAEEEAIEDGWARDKINEMEDEEEQIQNELMEYERVMAEEEKKRMEMIQWEIRDKEEHDKLLAMQERERNKTPKEEAEDKEDDRDTEITIKEEVVIVQASSAATISSSITVVTVAAILKLFF